MTSPFPAAPDHPAAPRPSDAGDSAYARAIRILAWINVLWIVGGLFLTTTSDDGLWVGVVALAPLMLAFAAPSLAAGISAGAVLSAVVYAAARRRSPYRAGYEFFAAGTMILTLALLVAPLIAAGLFFLSL